MNVLKKQVPTLVMDEAINKMGITVWLFSLSIHLMFGQRPQSNDPARPKVEVYVSSQEGDRLTKKKRGTFVSESKSFLPVISVNENKYYQTIEGFGATFNEAGMICVNSL